MTTDRGSTPVSEPGDLNDSWFEWPRLARARRRQPAVRHAPGRPRPEEQPVDDDLERGWFDRHGRCWRREST